ncbi:hypothetical protein [Nocardia sp. NPDC020380]|uniref:hypothetical protein n=1 Tax=Nocardia sp. NPDC020380 TaxID=3364309 RepID=UPI0037A296C9
MNMQNVGEIVLVVLVIGWVVYRQTQWQALDHARLWRLPIILGIIGALSLKSAVGTTTVQPISVVLLVVSAVLAVGVGLLMGTMSQVRQFEGRVEARTGVAGSMLWLVMLAVRIGVDVAGHVLNAGALVTSAGAIMIFIALNRAGRTLILARRSEELRMVAAH